MRSDVPARNICLEAALILFLLFAGGCASLPENNNRQVSYALKDTEDTTFGRKSAQRIETEGGGQDGFMLLESGLDAFVAGCSFGLLCRLRIGHVALL